MSPKRTAPVSEYGAGFEPLFDPLAPQGQVLQRRVEVERQYGYRPPRGVDSEQPRRQSAPGEVFFQHLMHLLTLAASATIPSDKLVTWEVSVGHHSGDLVPPSPRHLHEGDRQRKVTLHTRQGWLAQGLPDSQEAILRAAPFVAYPVGHEVDLGPLLASIHLVAPHNLSQLMPIVLPHVVRRALELRCNVHADGEPDHPEAFVSALGTILQQLLLVAASV